MKESHYLKQISVNRQRLDNIEREIHEKKKDLGDLYEFLKKHNEFTEQLGESIQTKRNRVNNANIVESKVRVYAQLKNAMNDLLAGTESQNVFRKKEEESNHIKKVIRDLENEIANLEAKRNDISNNISSLNYKLREVRLKNG
ncbi:MAG TPA: hypothetical protein VK071_05080 [Tissierellales bacterium]|nr:hypothetical protein [Tissierellales bacterium]